MKSLILDSTTQCKNAVKGATLWINREIEETNLNLGTIQYEIRKNEISGMNRMNKQKENKSKTYINDNIQSNT